MNVKKLSILLLGAFLMSWPTTVMAQDDDIPLREVSLGMGFGTSNLGIDWGYDADLMYMPYDESPLATYRRLKIYDDGSVQSPCYSIAFRQDFKCGRWMSYGLTASYEYKEDTWRSRATKRVTKTAIESYFTLMPTLRYYYLRHKGFRMYSEGGLGMSLYYQRSMREQSGHYKLNLTGQFTGFGIQVGKRVFFGTELGYGCLGVVRLMAGYRF